jgi:DNA-binding NarL/FixJ family response regulator
VSALAAPPEGAEVRRRARRERIVFLGAETLSCAVIAATLDSAPYIDLVAASGDEVEAFTLLREGRGTILLLDGARDRPEAVEREVKAAAAISGVSVVCLVEDSQAELIEQLLAAGARSCVSKAVPTADLPSVVRSAARGIIYRTLPRVGPAADAVSHLTPREIEILSLTAEGRGNKQIAQHLWVTEQTVKFHLSNVYRKLDVANRTEATVYAIQHGLVEGRGSRAAELPAHAGRP